MSKKTPDDESAQVTAELRGFLDSSKKLWTTLTKGTVWLVVAVGPLLLMPSLGLADNDKKTWMYFTSFILSVAVGLVFLMAKTWNKKKHTVRWALVSAGFAVLGAAGFVTYEVLKGQWTVGYERQQWIVGSEKSLTKEARAQPDLIEAALLQSMTITTYEKGGIWNKAALQNRWLILALIRVPTFQVFGLCIITLAQALRCSAAGKRGKAGAAAKPATRSAAKKPAADEEEDAAEAEGDAEAPPAEK